MSIHQRAGLAVAIIGALAGCATTPTPSPNAIENAWPRRDVAELDPAIERRIDALMSRLTLEQKIGQMTQAEIKHATPADVAKYQLGSVLNGGGSWPAMNKHASAAQWVALAKAYREASLGSFGIPVIWGIDAVHGNNNVKGATIYPHNIGLGAAHDPALVERIGHATAKAVRATGIDWAFAPTLAVVRNQRWGRAYEGYSSDPVEVARNGAALVRGLQGDLTGPERVIASAKHFAGDGGTFQGIDQGENRASAREFARVDGAGYYAALDANVQSVMISYSSWTPGGNDPQGKMHGNRTLISEVLKRRMAFDGLVVSDWNAIEQVQGCERDRCPVAVNAGIDLFMVPENWKAFIAKTAADVREGRIPMQRIDDAVRRILRVKLRMGLFDTDPFASPVTGQQSALENRALAQEAVRKSVVLVKNDDSALPLKAGARVLVIGEAADSLPKQTGGWSLTWQGDENVNADYGTGETLLAGLRRALGAASVAYSPDGSALAKGGFDAVVAVIAEAPHAEMKGDVRFPTPLAHSLQYPGDAALVAAAAKAGKPVVTVLYSGRTVYASDLLNKSDAFVAAFLPGSEAGALGSLLASSGDSDFQGTLSFAWPNTACPSGGEPAGETLFARGYGLRYSRPHKTGQVREEAIPAACR